MRRVGAGDEAFERDGEVGEDWTWPVDWASRENSSRHDRSSRRDGSGCWPSPQRSRHPDGGFAWLRADGTPDLVAPARAVDHDADDVRVRARRAARAAGRGRARRARARRRCARDFRDDATAAGSRRSAARTTSARTSTSSSCWPRRARAMPSCSARRWRCSTTHFWDERAGALRRRLEPRLERRSRPTAAPTRTCTASRRCSRPSDPLWLERAGRITQRLVVDNHPRLNEHFDADWRPLPDYNRAEPAHPFRPYGATIGHWFEWARLAYTLDAGRFEARGAAAVRGRDRSTAGTAAASSTRSTGTGGRSSPTGCTGCCARRSRAAAVLGEDALQAEWWELAERDFIDRERRLVAARARSVQPAGEHRLGRQARRLPRAAGDADPALSAGAVARGQPAR